VRGRPRRVAEQQQPAVPPRGSRKDDCLHLEKGIAAEPDCLARFDRRADIWAYGVVLHEMLTGERVFKAETISETLAAVLRDDVSFDGLPVTLPAPVISLLDRCLDRDPRTRLRDIGEARIALAPESLANAGAAPAATGGAAATAPAPGSKRERTFWAGALILLAAVAATGWSLATRTPETEAPREVRASIVPPEGMHFGSNAASSLSISPDGSKMTFNASAGSSRPMLYLRSLGSTDARELPGTEGASYPFWSPDSRWIGFFADGKVKKLNLDGGGAPQTLATASDARGGTWNADGTILFAPSTQTPISRVTDGGALGEPATTLDGQRGGETTHRGPWFLPDGRHFLFLRASHAAATVDSINTVWVGDTESDETVELMQSQTQAAYAQGHLFYVRDRFLMARPFSPERLEFTGDAFAVGEGVVVEQGAWRGGFAVSEAGPIAFHGGTALDQEGNVIKSFGEPASYSFVRLSPDDRYLAATVADSASGRTDLWIIDLERDVTTRLTFHEAQDTNPVWSPDQKQIAFASSRNSKADIFVRRTDGTGDAELLVESDGRAEPEHWSHDGKYLAYNHGLGKGDLNIVDVETGEVSSFIATEFDEGYARFSPDDKWIAYVSNESGPYQMYLTRFPSGEGKWQLTRDGSNWLLGWNDEGNEVYYLDPDGDLAAIKLTLGNQVIVDTPRKLFPARVDLTWAHTSDGQNFILGTRGGSEVEKPVTLILNWGRGLD
jgi:Tol biopolymer transport system component